MNKFLFLSLILVSLGCSNSGNEPNPTSPGSINPDPNAGTITPGKGQPGIMGLSGITDWDNLAKTEKDRIKGWNTIFMHQSVGGDLEDGTEANGYKFEYFDLTSAPKGPSGNVFSVSNGDPFGKIEEFKKNILTHKAVVNIAIFKFGYADVTDANKDEVKSPIKR